MELIFIVSINDIFTNHNSFTKKTFASEILEGVNSSFRMTDATVIQNCIALNQINSPATQRALQIHSFKDHSFTMENLFRTEVFKQFQEISGLTEFINPIINGNCIALNSTTTQHALQTPSFIGHSFTMEKLFRTEVFKQFQEISRLTEFINPTFIHNSEFSRSFAPLFTTADNFDEENLEELVRIYQDNPELDSILEDDNDFDEEKLYEAIQPFFNGFDLKGKFLKCFPKGKWKSFLIWIVMNIILPIMIGLTVNELSSKTIAPYSSQEVNETNIQNQTNIENQDIINNYGTINNQTIINQECSHQIVAVKPSIISSNWKRTKTRSKKK